MEKVRQFPQLSHFNGNFVYNINIVIEVITNGTNIKNYKRLK